MTTFQATVVTTLYPSFFNVMDNVERDDNDNNLECFQNDPLHLHLHPIQKEAANDKKEEGQKVEAFKGYVNGKL